MIDVTSRELSEKLALLPAMKGVDNYFYHYETIDSEHETTFFEVGNGLDAINNMVYGGATIPAYTLPELLGVLPSNIETKDCEHGGSHNCAWYGRCRFAGGLKIEKDVQDYIAGYECREHTYIAYESGDLTDATAQLVLFCGEQGHLEGEEGDV